MTDVIRVKVEGMPCEIQRVADALESAFPGALRWHHSATIEGTNTVAVVGVGIPMVGINLDDHVAPVCRTEAGELRRSGSEIKYPTIMPL